MLFYKDSEGDEKLKRIEEFRT